ncbi:hypothetical protein Pla175_49460 [Pirellulimonas nuda]|uniref:Cytochrome c domain-containing protein n=1 Tax=Pirellulimonas nuda TaxID=2528009 RepID=A0A518DJ63_9BACT|nr:DUF1549 and DUF1553 domain-containing protein [Pirellulimonas nuda]QDU91517.1 hypothetical protein Pla175_49460 [Pirellulimonas nuda]
MVSFRFSCLAIVAASVVAAAYGATGSATEAAHSGPVQLINQQIETGWRDQGITPSQPADDGAWCRRVYLDLLGRVPKVDELEAYVADRSNDKRALLVDRLLGDEYLQEYAQRWTTVWTNLLVGRTGGTNNDSLVSRAGMKQYLRRAFQKNKPMDVMMQELVTATGSCRPGDADFNGAANFLADKMAEDGVQATAKTAQIFLGTAVQCTQCHNHPFNEYKQNQFWELNAFFRQTRLERLPTDQQNTRVARILDRDFAGEGGDPSKAELYYELRNGKLKVAYPVFIDGTSLVSMYADRGEDYGDSGYLAEINRREELARLISQSPEFPKAIVNRVWGQLLGYGLTKPVDDMGPHNVPSHPELLDGLADSFRESSFDMKALLRWIALSEPYALDSRANRSNEQDDPSLGSRPMFSRFYLRQMEAEQLYESLLVATEADKSVGYAEREEMKQRWLAQFNTAFGNDENGEATTFNGSIPQALTLMNGELVKRATGSERGGLIDQVARDNSSGSEKIKRLYLAALARRPERAELQVCNQVLASRGGDMNEALQDIWWALLNSNEFILNH